MYKYKATLDFIKFSYQDKLVFCRNISIKIANATIFVTPDIPIANIVALIAEFEIAIMNAQNGGHAEIAIRRNKELKIDDMFRNLVYYVNKIANGDEAIILLSGFHASTPPPPHQKAEISAKDGPNSGDVRVIVKAVEDVVAYNFIYAKDAIPTTAAGWSKVYTSTRAYYDFVGLTAGAYYYFCMATISSKGISDYTDPIRKLVN